MFSIKSIHTSLYKQIFFFFFLKKNASLGSMYVYQRAGVVADDLQSLWGEALEPHRSSDFTSRYLHRSSV